MVGDTPASHWLSSNHPSRATFLRRRISINHPTRTALRMSRHTVNSTRLYWLIPRERGGGEGGILRGNRERATTTAPQQQYWREKTRGMISHGRQFNFVGSQRWHPSIRRQQCGPVREVARLHHKVWKVSQEAAQEIESCTWNGRMDF